MASYMTRQPVDWAAYMTWGFDSAFECEQEAYTMTAYRMSRKRVHERGMESRWSALQHSNDSPRKHTASRTTLNDEANKLPQIPLQRLNHNHKMTWTQNWSEEEHKTLQKLREDNNDREQKLANILGKDKKLPKWEWPPNAMEIVKKSQEAAEAMEKNRILACDLEGIVFEKDEKVAKYFYDRPGKMWNRPKNNLDEYLWFDAIDFHVFRTPYTFSDRWDKKNIMATFLVLNTLPAGHKAPVMWFFHGGGFVCEINLSSMTFGYTNVS
jgi:hypothetical protein